MPVGRDDPGAPSLRRRAEVVPPYTRCVSSIVPQTLSPVNQRKTMNILPLERISYE